NEQHVQETHVQPVHMQEVHVQDLHVVKQSQDVVVEDEKPTTSLPAKNARAIRQEDNPSKLEDTLFYVEGTMPKRRSKAWTEEINRVTEALWYTWPLAARKRHTRQAVFDAVASVLSNIKLNARGDDLIAAGRRHV